MNTERMQAIGRVEYLKKQIVQIGIQAGSHIQTISIEFNTLLTKKEWHKIDTNKVAYLVEELEKLQKQHSEAMEDLINLKETYGIE